MQENAVIKMHGMQRSVFGRVSYRLVALVCSFFLVDTSLVEDRSQRSHDRGVNHSIVETPNTEERCRLAIVMVGHSARFRDLSRGSRQSVTCTAQGISGQVQITETHRSFLLDKIEVGTVEHSRTSL